MKRPATSGRFGHVGTRQPVTHSPHRDEADPSLADLAQVAATLAERAMLMRGL